MKKSDTPVAVLALWRARKAAQQAQGQPRPTDPGAAMTMQRRVAA